MKEETREWLRKAKSDLDDARFNIQGNRSQLGAFMLQQAVEKALKALQIEKRETFERTHDLVKLASSMEIPQKFQRTLEELNPIYTGFRYPDVAEGEIKNVKERLTEVEEIFKWIEKQLEK